MKTLIVNEESKYYCIEGSKSVFDDNTPSDTDFPFWSSDINDAYDFGSKSNANNEMSFNELGSNLSIIELP